MENDRAQYCVMCGTELNEFYGVFGSEQRHKNQKFIPFCRKCQQEYFDMLAKETTPHLAMFYCCIAFESQRTHAAGHVPKEAMERLLHGRRGTDLYRH